MSVHRRVLDELQRQALAAFVEAMFCELNPGKRYSRNWHIETICWQLEQVARGKSQRLIITMPPRSLKSFIGSVASPLSRMGAW